MKSINKCECGSFNIIVTNSRKHGCEIWRTRVCQDCGKRYYTTELCRDDIPGPKTEQIKQAAEIIKKGMDLLNAME